MYEHQSQPLLPWPLFARRMARHGGFALIATAISLAIGTAGFHYWARQEPIDAFLNASMLLGGMGPIGEIQGTGGKLFASGYALFAGLFFLAAGTILMAPLLHRLMHSLHIEEGRQGGGKEKSG
jgi:hypothetical protein